MTSKLFSRYRTLPKYFRWGIPIALVLLMAVGAYFIFFHQPDEAASSSTSADVQYATAQTGSIIISASGSGTLIAKDEASVAFGTSGTIMSLDVKVGDSVVQGQVLAQMDPADAQYAYETARNNYLSMVSTSAVATAQQALGNARDDLASARSELQYIVSPTVVTWMDIVENDRQALESAKTEAAANPSDAANAALSAAEVKLAESQKSLNYAWAYWEEDYVPAVFTETETTRDGQELVVYYTDSNGQSWPVVDKPTQTDIELASAAYTLAKAAVEEKEIYLTAIQSGEIPTDALGSEIANLRAAKKSMELALEALNAVTLTAPISGTVMSVMASAGDEVNGGSTVLTLSDLGQPYYIEAYFDESDWGTVKVGNEARVVFDILPEDTYTGTVTEVTPSLVSGGGSSLVHCYITLTDILVDELPGGTAASVEVIGAKAENVVLVPVEAVREVGDGQYGVFVVVNGELELTFVEVGITNDIKIEIISGVNAGQQVSTGIMETVQ